MQAVYYDICCGRSPAHITDAGSTREEVRPLKVSVGVEPSKSSFCVFTLLE